MKEKVPKRKEEVMPNYYGGGLAEEIIRGTHISKVLRTKSGVNWYHNHHEEREPQPVDEYINRQDNLFDSNYREFEEDVT